MTLHHLHTLRVRGFHTDLYGHVNNARYLEFLEEARWALLEAGPGLDWWTDQGLGFVVASITIHYRLPATLGWDLIIRSRPGETGRRSARIHQEILHEATGETIAEAEITFVVVDMGTGRSVPLDGRLVEALEAGFEERSGE